MKDFYRHFKLNYLILFLSKKNCDSLGMFEIIKYKK